MLTAAIFIPILAAALMALLPRDRGLGAHPRRLMVLSTIVAAIPLVLLVVAWLGFDGTGGFEQVETIEWIPSLGVAYRVGIDGLSLPLAAMTALIFVVAPVCPPGPRSPAWVSATSWW